jgi:hypothetical protein
MEGLWARIGLSTSRRTVRTSYLIQTCKDACAYLSVRDLSCRGKALSCRQWHANLRLNDARERKDHSSIDTCDPRHDARFATRSSRSRHLHRRKIDDHRPPATSRRHLIAQKNRQHFSLHGRRDYAGIATIRRPNQDVKNIINKRKTWKRMQFHSCS